MPVPAEDRPAFLGATMPGIGERARLARHDRALERCPSSARRSHERCGRRDHGHQQDDRRGKRRLLDRKPAHAEYDRPDRANRPGSDSKHWPGRRLAEQRHSGLHAPGDGRCVASCARRASRRRRQAASDGQLRRPGDGRGTAHGPRRRRDRGGEGRGQRPQELRRSTTHRSWICDDRLAGPLHLSPGQAEPIGAAPS